jgi:hypothetical protein
MPATRTMVPVNIIVVSIVSSLRVLLSGMSGEKSINRTKARVNSHEHVDESVYKILVGLNRVF